MAWNHDEEQCPLAAVDRRLDDLHRLWHQAEAAYFDPDAFRVAIQAAIQTARTVTLVLQKNKRLIPDFDAWYEPWQQKLGADSLMKWMVDARNRIEKEGDLQAHSFVHAEIVASHLDDGPHIQVPAKLFDAPLALLRSIPPTDLGDHIKKNGILRIHRRWIENTLPDYELLDAVSIAYGRLAELVYDAHRQMNLESPVTTDTNTGEDYPEGDRKGRLPCMIGHAEARKLDIWLATGRPLEFEAIPCKVDLRSGPKLLQRYGIEPREMFAASGIVTEQLRSLFSTARKMLKKDGHHIMVAFLLRGGKPVEIRELRPQEHGHKYLMMRELANEVLRVDADAVILISESWSAPVDPAKPYMRASDSPQRREFLTATAVMKAGEPLHLAAEILRDRKKVHLGETTEHIGGSHYVFAPIYEAWGKKIPAAWVSTGRSAESTEAK